MRTSLAAAIMAISRCWSSAARTLPSPPPAQAVPGPNISASWARRRPRTGSVSHGRRCPAQPKVARSRLRLRV